MQLISTNLAGNLHVAVFRVPDDEAPALRKRFGVSLEYQANPEVEDGHAVGKTEAGKKVVY